MTPPRATTPRMRGRPGSALIRRIVAVVLVGAVGRALLTGQRPDHRRMGDREHRSVSARGMPGERAARTFPHAGEWLPAALDALRPFAVVRLELGLGGADVGDAAPEAGAVREPVAQVVVDPHA